MLVGRNKKSKAEGEREKALNMHIFLFIFDSFAHIEFTFLCVRVEKEAYRTQMPWHIEWVFGDNLTDIKLIKTIATVFVERK